MKAYIINLPQSTRRRAHIEEQVRVAGLDYQLVKAVDGGRLTETDRAGLVDEEAVARYPGWLTPGIVGAALSHYQAYEEILEDREELALVLEDDAVLSRGTSRVLEAVGRYMQGSEVVLLYYRSWERCLFSSVGALDVGGGARLAYPMDVSQPTTAAAYLITAEGAARMSDVVLPVRAGPDSWGLFHEQGGIDRLRCVIPRPIGVRSDFKSVVDYLGTGTVQRLAQSIDRRRTFPLYQLLQWKRRRREDRMSRFELVSEPSPFGPHRSS